MYDTLSTIKYYVHEREYVTGVREMLYLTTVPAPTLKDFGGVYSNLSPKTITCIC